MTMEQNNIALDRELRELLIPYLEGVLTDTEYEGKMAVISQYGESPGENTIVVAAINETDATNAYNGITGHDNNFNVITFRHDRDITILIETNMSDNDALWMFSKYLIMCLIRDQVILTSSGKLKIAQHPVNQGIAPKDLGDRKIWQSRISLAAKIHNEAQLETEIY